MAGLLIKDLPPELHQALKEQAARHHRSMTKEVVVLLERALRQRDHSEHLAPPFKGRFPLTDEFIDRAKRDGRE